MKSREERIGEILTKEFNPTHLKLIDESHKHAGHHGHDGSAGSHFRLVLVSDAFRGMSKLQRQQKVCAALKSEFLAGLHAFSQQIYTESEWQENSIN